MNLDRTSHPSAEQVETLLNFLERNPRLAKGFPRHNCGRQAAKKEWGRIITRLNSMPGTTKSAQKWIKYWSDKKSATRKKHAACVAFNETGIGEVPPELSDIEERILTLMAAKDIKIEPNRIKPINIPSNSIQPSIDPNSIQPIIIQATNESSRENSPSIQESEPEAQSSAINTTVLPSIEQRCVDIDNRLIAIMERNCERDKLLVEATQTMAEGLKTMGQGLKAMGEGFKAMGEGLKALAETINR